MQALFPTFQSFRFFTFSPFVPVGVDLCLFQPLECVAFVFSFFISWATFSYLYNNNRRSVVIEWIVSELSFCWQYSTVVNVGTSCFRTDYIRTPQTQIPKGLPRRTRNISSRQEVYVSVFGVEFKVSCYL